MRGALISVVLLAGLAGCECASKRHCTDACPPETCRQAETQPCEQVVHVPRQKIVVETPPPAPQQAPPTPQQAPPAPQQAPPVPQQSFQMQMAPGMMGMPMMGFGQQMAAPMMPVTAQVRERTGLGLAFDTIRIPIPFLRFIPVQRPAEMSFEMPMSAPPAAFPMQASYPMTAPMMAPPMMTAPMGGMAAANVAMVPQPTLSYGQVTMQSQIPVSQLGLQQSGAQVTLNAQQMAALQAALSGVPQQAPPSAAALQAQLEECRKKVKELEELKKKDKKDE
jgi:hypothetical protein